jgi:hypothetical protein
MPEWVISALHQFGLGNVIVIALGFGAAVIWRSAWPFYVKEVWPEVKLSWQYKRTSQEAQANKLSALYDVLIQINSDNVRSNAATVATLREIESTFRQSIGVLEMQANSRHDALIDMFAKLADKIERQIDVMSQLVNQWQRISIPSFIDDRRENDEPFNGPEKRNQ